MTASALLLEKVHATAESSLRDAGYSVQRIDKGLSEDELIEALNALPEGPVMIGIRSKTRVTAKVFEAVPRLDAIGCFCIGTDQVALDVARARGVTVFNAPFSSTRSVAELVMADIVMLARRIFPRNTAAHDGTWAKSAQGAHEVRGKTVGIVGYGHIGSQLGILAEAFGMKVHYYDIEKKLPLGNTAPVDSMDELLATSDFVTLHVPDTEITRGLITAEEIGKMKQGAYLINLSRGKVVDIEALQAALKSGHLAGAAVDVYPQEPASNAEPFVSPLRGLENVILTPHIGGSTMEAQANIGLEVAGALTRFRNFGGTAGSVTLPNLDVPRPKHSGEVSRIINLHRNVPGVLSEINRVVAESGINIVGQSLGTNDDVGLLFIDVPVAADDPEADKLRTSIAGLQTSLRTRIVKLP
ncbi:MAG: phosphoglycerate dehydrogenase [Myxococcota bacterium]